MKSAKCALLHGVLSIFVLSLLLCVLIDSTEAKMFQFSRYTYRKKGGNQHLYKSRERNCENNSCSELSGLERTSCIRKCISENCYKELYSWDELEEGEIDVRLNSFKGCSVQEIKRIKRDLR